MTEITTLQEFVYLVESNQTITELQQLIDLVESNQTEKIRVINFFNSKIGADGATELAEWIKKTNLPNLQYILLSYDHGEGAKALAGVLKNGNLPNLLYILLHINNIGADEGKVLANAFKEVKLPNLEEIGFSCINIGADGAKHLADGFKKGNLPNLQKIDLACINNRAEGRDKLVSINRMLEHNTKLVSKVKEVTTSKYSQEWDNFSEQEQDALFNFEYAEYLYQVSEGSHQKEGILQAALGLYGLAMPAFKSSSRSQFKECEKQIVKTMVAIIRQSGEEPDSLPGFIKECFTNIDIKIFEDFSSSNIVKPHDYYDKNLAKLIFSWLPGHQKSELFFDALNKVKPQFTESIDVQAVGLDEYQGDEACNIL